jgi:hypothetical protein
LFYDPRRKVQLRLSGMASVHTADDLAWTRWSNSPARSRRCYGVDPAPGTPISRPDSGLTEALEERSPTPDESNGWFDRFAVIETRIDRLDWLYLRARGHRRARFEWTTDEMVSTWLIP